jgi:hypothetical protein
MFLRCNFGRTGKRALTIIPIEARETADQSSSIRLLSFKPSIIQIINSFFPTESGMLLETATVKFSHPIAANGNALTKRG